MWYIFDKKMLSLDSYNPKRPRLKMKIYFDGDYRIEPEQPGGNMALDLCSTENKPIVVEESRGFLFQNVDKEESVEETFQETQPKLVKRKKPVRRGEWTAPVRRSRKRKKLVVKRANLCCKPRKTSIKLVEKLDKLIHYRVFPTSSTCIFLQESIDARNIERVFLPEFDQIFDDIIGFVRKPGLTSDCFSSFL